MYQLIVESILGLQLEHRDGQAWLQLRPCMPVHWPGFDIDYRFGHTPYRIRVSRNAELAADTLSLDQTPLAGNELPLHDDGRAHEALLALSRAPRSAIDPGGGVLRAFATHADPTGDATKVE